MPSVPRLNTLRKALASHAPRRIPDAARRSSVAVVLRAASAYPPTAPGGGGARGAGERERQDFEVLYLRRAEQHGDPWSGQVSFPGGKQDPEDLGNDRRTAIRETLEEIGVEKGVGGEVSDLMKQSFLGEGDAGGWGNKLGHIHHHR